MAVPGAIPRIPAEPVAAIEGSLLLHVPLLMVLVKVAIPEGQIELVPVIVPASGNELTVKVTAVLAVPQLLDTAYVIMAVPVLIALTTPIVLTVALLPLLVHVPPVTEGINIDVPPGHAVVIPLMVPASGADKTLIVVVAVAELQELATV